jgi:hypothetical protein
MHYSAPQLAFALVPMFMLLIVAARMLIKRLYIEFPLFFAYSIFHAISIAATLVAARSNPWTYFYTYWGFELADVFLSIAVVQEIYSQAFGQYAAIQNLGKALFKWATIMLLMLCLVSASASPGSDSERIMAGLLVLSRSANLLIGGLLLLLFMICGVFAVSWKRYAFGFALGLALLSSISLAVVAIRAHVGESFHHYLQVVAQLSYNIAAVVWVINVFAKQADALHSTTGDQSQLRDWNRALQGLLRQ